MMQEEDCLDLSPSPDNMAGVDVSFGDVDSSGPTLLLAASAAKLETSESSDGGIKGLVAKTKDVGVIKNALGDTDEVSSSSVENENEVAGGESKLKEEATENGKTENDDSSRVRQLFGGPSDGESFGASVAKSNALSTASVLFANGDNSGGSELFGRNERADSFSKLVSTKASEFVKREENRMRSGESDGNSLNDSFQALGITNHTAMPPPMLSPQVPAHPNSNMAESSQSNQASQSLIHQPQVSAMQTPLGGHSSESSMTAGSFTQSAGGNQLYPGIQSQVPMYPSPNNQQLQQDKMSVPFYNSQDPTKFQNGANVGNSYMYTAPITSVLPGYEPSQSDQLPQKQVGTRLHQSHVPKQTVMSAGELFVPDLYGHSTSQPSNQVNIFTPSPDMHFGAQNMPQNVPEMQYGAQNMPPSNNFVQNQYTSPAMPPYSIQDYEQYSNQPNFYPGDSQDPGFWEWVKNQDWSEGAQKLGKQLLQKTKCTIKWVGSTVIDHASKVHLSKNATDTVLTTLDPGMEEYLKPSVHLAIASQDDKILQAVRQGFKQIFGHTAAKGHYAPHSLPKLPIGFDFGTKAVVEQLDALSTIDFKFNQPYVHVAMQPFLTELQQGCWSCMFCMALRDCPRRIELRTYSQPVSIPSACISMAYSRTSQENASCGFDVSVDEAVRLFKPYAGDEDWCFTLNGIRLETILSLAAQGLAADYRRELENSALTQNDSFVVLPS